MVNKDRREVTVLVGVTGRMVLQNRNKEKKMEIAHMERMCFINYSMKVL